MRTWVSAVVNRMTLRERVVTWWNRDTPVAACPAAVVPVQRPAPLVPAEYLSLYTYLDNRYASTVVLTFAQMEALLGFALPAPARTERGWWTGEASDWHSAVWTLARRTATPNLPAGNVAFERVP